MTSPDSPSPRTLDFAAIRTDLVLSWGHLPDCGEGAEFPWDCTCGYQGRIERMESVIARAEAAQEAPAPDEAAAVAAALRKIDADLTAYGPVLAPHGITVNAPLIVAALHDAGYRVAQEARAPEGPLGGSVMLDGRGREVRGRGKATSVEAVESAVAKGNRLIAERDVREAACPLCTVGIAQQEPDLHLTSDCGCECHVAQGGSR